MIDLIKRSTKDTPLTWNDLDDNWAQIEDSLNALGSQQLYSVHSTTVLNSCAANGTNTHTVNIRIRVLNDVQSVPMLRGCVVLNGKIALAGESMGMFLGNVYPLVGNTVTNSDIGYILQIGVDQYPATVGIYFWDEKGNYAAPYSYIIDENPCAFVNLVSCLTGLNVATFGRTLDFTVQVNGSDTYKLEYFDGDAWQDLHTFTTAESEVSLSVPIADSIPTGLQQIRVVDVSNGAISNTLDVLLNYSDWYAWHLPAVSECDGTQKLTMTYNIGRMPASTLVLEYDSPAGGWETLATYEFDTPMQMPYAGGETMDVAIPAGTYNFRLRNLLTGSVLLNEGVDIIACEDVELDIEITTADVACAEATGYMRKLNLQLELNVGSGDYKVQVYYAGYWDDMHEFSHTTGTALVDFYVPSSLPWGTHNIRIIDIANDATSNEVSVVLAYTDSYEWTTAPTAYCDGSTQKLDAALTFSNTPASALILEVYAAGTWVELSSTEVPATGSNATSLGSPITIAESLDGTYNVRLRNTITGNSILTTDVAFASCAL